MTRLFMTAKCPCQNCSNHIEFDQSQAGTTVVCPQCGLDTMLFVPSPLKQRRLLKRCPTTVRSWVAMLARVGVVAFVACSIMDVSIEMRRGAEFMGSNDDEAETLREAELDATIRVASAREAFQLWRAHLIDKAGESASEAAIAKAEVSESNYEAAISNTTVGIALAKLHAQRALEALSSVGVQK